MEESTEKSLWKTFYNMIEKNMHPSDMKKAHASSPVLDIADELQMSCQYFLSYVSKAAIEEYTQGANNLSIDITETEKFTNDSLRLYVEVSFPLQGQDVEYIYDTGSIYPSGMTVPLVIQPFECGRQKLVIGSVSTRVEKYSTLEELLAFFYALLDCSIGEHYFSLSMLQNKIKNQFESFKKGG